MSRITALIYDDSGEIFMTRTGAIDSVMADVDGTQHIITDAQIDPATSYVKDGEIRARDPRPSESHEWDGATESWVANLDLAKDERWQTIKRQRQHHERGGFTYGGKVYDSDIESTLRITRAGALAQGDLDGFSIDWTTADNDEVTLTGAEMVALDAALAQHVAAGHAHSRALRAAINAATTEAEVLAVQWAL